MKSYKIKVIAHQLKGKQIAVFGDVVGEKQLNGNADELVASGFIEEIEAEKVFDFSTMTKKDLVQFAFENKIEVDDKAKNEDLIKVIKEGLENIEDSKQ